jgi:long-subunit fatty acid transport protein
MGFSGRVRIGVISGERCRRQLGGSRSRSQPYTAHGRALAAVASHQGLAAATLALSVGLFALPAHADPFHHQPVPMGERALGMGGAFTGLANEPSAAYYNPAGLVRLDDTTLSAGLTLIALDRVKINHGYRTGSGSANLSYDTNPALPLFVSLVKQLGRRDGGGKRRHAFAFSTFTLDQRSLDYDVQIKSQGAPGHSVTDTLHVHQDYTVRLHGFSYAYRINEAFSVGISAFWSTNKLNYAEERLHVDLGPPNATGSHDDTATRFDSMRTGYEVTNAVARVAALYAQPRYRLGLMFQFPSIDIKGKGSVRDRSLVTMPGGGTAQGNFAEARNGHLPADEPFPWELRGGISYGPTADFTVSWDLSVYGKNGNTSHPIRAIGRRNPAPDTGLVPRAGDYAVDAWHTKMTANVSIGTEYIVYDALVFRGGVFTDLSAAPNLPSASATYRPADIHRFGAALSMGLVSSGYDVSLGAVARLGYGDAMSFASSGGALPYQRTGAQEHTVYVFLTGARKAIGKLASKAVQKLTEVRGADDEEPQKAQEEPKAPPPTDKKP